ncbi:MAG: hypothetical protein ACT4NK_08130 [Limnobacter sp.]|uniref:hypothetical protein n=1 Tax=Limnobacter sp. TaxID=2003368 RepID=UPI004037DB29
MVKTAVAVRLGDAAIAPPPIAKLAEAKTAQDKNLFSFFILSPDSVGKASAHSIELRLRHRRIIKVHSEKIAHI